MAISFACANCGKRLRVDEKFAGRTVRCPACKEAVGIPLSTEDADAAAYGVLSSPEEERRPPPPKFEFNDHQTEDESDSDSPARNKPRFAPPTASLSRSTSDTSLQPLVAHVTPLWLRHLHWLLALALVPLIVSLLHKSSDEDDLVERILSTLKEAPPDVQNQYVSLLLSEKMTKQDLDNLCRSMPNRRLIGAFLPVDSKLHWVMALGAIVLFTGFFMLLASDGSASPLHLFLVGLFTGTIGIVLLLLLQLAAAASQGAWIRGRGIGMIIFLIIKLIGYSYAVADDPTNNFFLSFLGFTVGVGFCEETCKMLPVLFRFRRENDYNWRNAFLWGLASGAGFGISEGIMYAGQSYNGITGGEIYLVRFISCVALHAVWTASAAVMLHRKQHLLQQSLPWYGYIVPLIVYIGIPMVLHGMYDTCLKKEINSVALAVALASFAYLAVQIYLLHGADDVEANKEMLREYRRRRKAMT